ncbi:histidine kinase dimerization/phospho-acceptor domain-containing protein [Archaeoglobus sp.]
MDKELRRINELLFSAFTFSSNVWMFKSRDEMIKYFCDHVIENDNCTGVVVSDENGEHYRMNENVLKCKYLNYIPRVFSVVNAEYCECENVEHKLLLSIPISNRAAAYIFLKEADEETVQILKDMVTVLSRAIENLEMNMELEAMLSRLKANLQQLEYLSDRLRNPLSVILGVYELKDEIGTDKAFEMVRRSAEKIKEVLDNLSDAEVKSKEMFKKLSYDNI